MFWFWLLILLLLFAVFLLPPWPYMREREMGYAPSGIAFAVLLIILLLWWFGMVAVWWPWYQPVAV